MPSGEDDMRGTVREGASLDDDALLVAVLSALPVGVLVADKHGRVVDANARAGRILRGMVPVGPVEGMPAESVLDLSDWPLARAIRGGGACIGEFVDVEFPDGARSTLHVSAVPIRRNGTIDGGVAVVQEVTASKRRELLSLALNDVNAAVLSLLDIPDHMRSVLADGAAALGAEAAVLAVREGEGWTLRHPVGLPDEGEAIPIGELLESRLGEGVAGAVEAFELDDAGVEGAEYLRGLGFAWVLAAPLAVTSRTRGVVAFLSSRPFDEEAEDFARKLSTSVSLALRSAEAFERAHDEVLRARLLEEVAVAATSGLDLEKTAERVLVALRDRMHLLAGAVALRDGDELQLLASFGIPAHDASPATRALRIPGTGDITTADAHRGLPPTHDDVPWRRHSNAFDPEGDASEQRYISAPLLYAGRVLGVLDLVWEHERPFSSDERELVGAIAHTLAQAVENARLFNETRENERLSRALNDIDAYLTAAVDVEEIAQPVLRSSVSALGMKCGAMLSRSSGEWEVVAVHGLNEDALGSRYAPDALTFASRALAEGDVVCVEDIETEDPAAAEFCRGQDVRSLMVAPLMRGDEGFGCLVFADTEPRRLSAAKREFVGRLGAHMSLALRTARLFAAQRNIAQTLQEAMLALPREVPGVLVSHLYQSAALEARVGGDFFDVFELDHGLLGVVIGDVSGKGLDAAVLTALVKNTLRAHAVEKRKTPAAVAELVNDVLLKESRPETFVTLFFGMLDRRDGRLVYCNCGHPSAVILHEDGMAARLAPNSPICGAFSTSTFHNCETSVGLDDLLFLYTDGLTEARRAGELYGEERLFVQLARVCDTRPERAIRRVVDDVVRFASGRLVDDVAVLAIKRVPLPSQMPVQQKLPLWAGR